ncbi:alpha/beta hydrolase [Aquabacterium sp.]|uniref:alpha/beta fold hydrolase n=1 Tax=Aquabacterium sp. TaxID=1872578 RepID=UPI00248901F1|nr:alpha/beta hydrolase [Aquabacterium sp.]MDI1349581.1 alpha/beta hydrolase [Aquabacterium sp.]
MDIGQHVVQQGSGEPIVLVHGSYATTSTWKKMVERLSQTHHCIAIKLPGHGGMPDPTDFASPSIETELAVIEAAVRQFTDRPIHLVGHSYGGVVALAQALKGSVPVSRLTLFEPVATWVLDVVEDEAMQAELAAFLGRYRRDAAAGQPHVCGQVIDFWGGGDHFAALPAHIQDAMGTMVANNLRHWDICTVPRHSRADLAALNIPTHLICGTRSNAVARAIVDHLHAELPHSQRTDIEGASHALVTSHPEACLAALLDERLLRAA